MAIERKVAVITGASQGIGAALVKAYRDRNYRVVATARTMAPSHDDDIISVAGDIADRKTAERAIAAGVDRFGRIDTLVNNAGIFISKPFTDYTREDYAAITAVNLTGFFHITQRAIAQMVKQGDGHVVNISTSIVEHPTSEQPAALVALTKGGLAAVTRSLAIEYASRGVRVNALSPGVIRTPAQDPASYEGVAELHPLGRVGEIADIVEGIMYLERATFVTGELLHIDGGQAAGG
jgi:NAD(P)-dependent dehydrogenase (short-subunit alcohol dehydrogenase family)